MSQSGIVRQLDEVFLATMFSPGIGSATTGAGHASRDSGLLLGVSADGTSFPNMRRSPYPIYLPATGVRDPSMLYRDGQWYMVCSHGEDVEPLVFLAKSSDLLHWAPMGSLRLAANTDNNFIDVPQWIVDPEGDVHLIACWDDPHHYVETHPLSTDPATWGEQANWSPLTPLTDRKGEALVQGNSFVALRNGTYYLTFNDIASTVYYMRTSTDLTSGWSSTRPLNLENMVNHGDSLSLLFLSDGSLRFYISNGNSQRNLIWYVDSHDFGSTWTSPKVVKFAGFGFGPTGINWANWAHFFRITDPAAIASIAAATQIPPKLQQQ